MLIKMFAQRICSNLVKNNLQKQFYHIAKHPITITPCLINNCIAIQCPSKPVVQFTTPSRFYAKGKDKKKDKSKTKVQVNEQQLGEVLNIDSYKTSLQKALDTMKDDFTKNLSLRSTTGSIESIQVQVDGKDHSLQELAQIVRKNPKTIVVNMAVFPQAIPAVLKALQKSGMNLNPQQEGTTLYIPVPKVTKEHRENLSKNAKALFIKCRDAMKDAQNKQSRNIKKNDGVSQDLARSLEQQVIQIANEFVKDAEKILETKQAELVGKE
ncbi:ribosome-recycling factor, mitochondrial-like isoform X1 [Atheta coriaria]|uniref:ribosome-recycling factor, mitochondrial-like isoform X1 n=1 Tax=Dalotia coriaria TaxID=877792 RepID=UPI0031F3EFBC